MIRIPKYEPHQLATRVGNIDPGFVQPLVNRAGQDATSSTVQSLLDSGKQLTDVAIKEYVSSETARVSQSLLAMKNDMATERDRYMQENQGEKALDAGAHFEQFAQKTAQDYMQKGGFSGKFAQMFNQQAAIDALSFTETGQAYGRQQKQAWQDSVVKGETEAFLADAAQHYNDPEWMQANRQTFHDRVSALRPGMDNLLPYSVYQAMDAPHKALSEITKAIDLINKIPSMTPDEKRQQIDSLYFHAIEVAKFGNKVFEALQPDIERLKQRAEGK